MMHVADVPRFTPKTAVDTSALDDPAEVIKRDVWKEYEAGAIKRERRKLFAWMLLFILCAAVALVIGYKVAKAGEVYVGKPMNGTVAICDTLDEAMDIFNAAMDNYHAGLHMLRTLSNQKNADGAPRCGEYTGPMMFTNLLVSRTTTLPDGTTTPMHVAAISIPAGNFFAIPLYVTFGEGNPVQTRI